MSGRLIRANRRSMPKSMAGLQAWIHDRLRLQHDEELALLGACAAVVSQQRKRLTDQAHRDPKTRLLHFPRFMNRLEWVLGFEQRLRWCAVGLVDIANFKSYNDTLGHVVGDRIIERVADILAQQIRSKDLLAASQSSRSRRPTDLHARFGGDEFAFLLPDVASFSDACRVAQRFKTVVERHDWASVNPALANRSVLVDVGMACIHLGPLVERKSHARPLAAKLVERADQLMYAAKCERSDTVRSMDLRLHDTRLVNMIEEGDGASSSMHGPHHTSSTAWLHDPRDRAHVNLLSSR